MILFKRGRIIQNWVREHFSDQKLAEVYAFNEDGKMSVHNFCSCILGVTFCTNLHTNWFTQCSGTSESLHYMIAKRLPGADRVEMAYLKLLRPQWALSRILSAEMERRAALAALVDVQVADQRVAERIHA